MIDTNKPEIANSIRELMFIFEDVATLDDAAIREIIQRVDKKDPYDLQWQKPRPF